MTPFVIREVTPGSNITSDGEDILEFELRNGAAELDPGV